MKIRAIRTDADLDWALSEIEQYFDTPPTPGTEEADRFDILTDLIEAYENREYPVEALDPIETLKVFMEIKKKRPSDLAELVGGKPRASEILKRKRPLTLRMIQKINSSWKIPASSLIAPYHLEANGEIA
jgi:HTH-type transcriptional regulator/antitoxin HigA